MKKNAIEYIKSHDLIRHNMVFFVGSLFIALFNYLYYPIIGRMVSVSSFGEIQAIISIFMQLGIILTTFGYVVTNIVNNTKNHAKSEQLIIKLEQITLIICITIFVLLCAVSLSLKTSLQFTSIIPLILVGILIIINVPSTSRTYFLQGLRRLKEVSIAGIIFSVGKLVISVVLILLGYNVAAVMIGYIIAQTITLLYLLAKTKNGFSGLTRSFSLNHISSAADRKVVKAELVYGLAILVLLSGITLMYTSDSIIVRLFFSPAESGTYSGISAVSRIVFFVTASIAGVLIASVKMEDSRKTNEAILRKSFALMLAIGGMVSLFFSIFPIFSVTLLLGAKYAGTAYLLPLMSLLILVCSFNNLLICYDIALRRFKIIYSVIAGIAILCLLITLSHDSFIHIVLDYLISNLVVFVLISVQVLKRKDHAQATTFSRIAQL